MGTIVSRMSRPFKNWNVENRAHKVIARDKPKIAPTYDSTQKQIELVNKFNPEYKEESQKKHAKLDDYLKQVYVDSNSTQVNEIDSRSNPDRPLPKERTLQEGFEFGFYEEPKVREGKVSLRQALEFIDNHSKDPEKYTVAVIAEKYKLDPKLTVDILDYYKLFEVRKTEENFNEDATARVSLSQRSGIRVKHPVKPKPIEIKTDKVKKTKVLRQIEDH